MITSARVTCKEYLMPSFMKFQMLYGVDWPDARCPTVRKPRDGTAMTAATRQLGAVIVAQHVIRVGIETEIIIAAFVAQVQDTDIAMPGGTKVTQHLAAIAE